MKKTRHCVTARSLDMQSEHGADFLKKFLWRKQLILIRAKDVLAESPAAAPALHFFAPGCAQSMRMHIREDRRSGSAELAFMRGWAASTCQRAARPRDSIGIEPFQDCRGGEGRNDCPFGPSGRVKRGRSVYVFVCV